MFEIVHTKLGKLIYEDEGWWKGRTEIDGLKVEFFVDGSAKEINETLAEDCAEVLADFHKLKEKALVFLEKHRKDQQIHQELEFMPTEIWNFFRKGTDKYFTMGFIEKTKPGYLWRVEFENSEPKEAGFDS